MCLFCLRNWAESFGIHCNLSHTLPSFQAAACLADFLGLINGGRPAEPCCCPSEHGIKVMSVRLQEEVGLALAVTGPTQLLPWGIAVEVGACSTPAFHAEIRGWGYAHHHGRSRQHRLIHHICNLCTTA